MNLAPASAPEPAEDVARRLLRGRSTAALATSLDGRPYVTLVLTAPDADGAPLLLLSDLAQHTQNILADPRVSLLLESASALPDPLTGERLTVIGEAARHDDPAALALYVKRHASAARYAGFKDFHLYRVTVERAHLVAGFGRIGWIDAASLR